MADQMSSLEVQFQALRGGSIRQAARLISKIEARDPDIRELLAYLYARGGQTPVIGLTGPPGAGKSSLVNELIGLWRERGERVAVLAVDPSSLVSGGAILGDRVRMNRHNTDPGVFIRSMSARGRLGGLCGACGDALTVLDVMGFDRIVVETVGVGQNEIDILQHANTVLVVQTPIGGDNIQAMKSGLLDIADVFIINKSDAPGADRMASTLIEVIHSEFYHHRSTWVVPIVKTQAVGKVGIDELAGAIADHQRHLQQHPDEDQKRLMTRIRSLLLERCTERVREKYLHGEFGPVFEQQVSSVASRERDPHRAAEMILTSLV